MTGLFILATLAVIVTVVVSLKTPVSSQTAPPHGLYCPCPVCMVFKEPK